MVILKNEVSALMDGEIESEDVSRILEMINKNNELKYQWGTYHLISDALRQSSQLSVDLSPHIAAKLQNEPIIFAPNISHSFKKQKRKIAMLAVAASVVLCVSVVVGLSQYFQEPKQQILAESKKQGNEYHAVPMTVSTQPQSQSQSIKNYPLVFEQDDFSFLHGEARPAYVRSYEKNSNMQYIEYRKSETADD